MSEPAQHELLCRSIQCAAAGASSGGQVAQGSRLTQQDLALLARLLRWPAPNLFPALDIARLAALDLHAATSLASTAGLLLLSPQGQPPVAQRTVIRSMAELPQSLTLRQALI